jgi:hypothetical protein
MKTHATWLMLVLAVTAAVPTAVAQDAAGELVLIDLRPEEEKGGFGLVELSGKCNKEVFRIPDVASDPMKVDLLKSDIAAALADSGAGKTLTVLNWSIYYNKQVRGSRGSGLSSVGVQGYSLPTKKQDGGRQPGSLCAKRETAGGFYDGSELESVYFPLISEFTGTYAGKPITARVIVSPRRKLPGKFEGDEADTDTLLDAVHKTSEAVALAIVQ